MVNKAVSAITTRLHSMYINVMLLINSNCIIGVMVRCAHQECWRSWASKTVFAAFLLSMQHSEERAKNDWLGIRIICPSGSTCPPSSISSCNVTCSVHDIAENCSFGIKQQSLRCCFTLILGCELCSLYCLRSYILKCRQAIKHFSFTLIYI